MTFTAGSRKPVLLAPVHCAPKALSSPNTSNCPSLLGIKSRSQRRFTNISLYFCVMRWMQCPHKPIPKGEMRSVIAIYKTVMLIMMGNAHERGWWPTCLSSEFVSRMTYNPHHMIV